MASDRDEIDKATALDELRAMAVDLWPPPWVRQIRAGTLSAQ